MQVTLDIPDQFAGQLAPSDQDPARIVLEALAIEAYRDHRLTEYQLQQLLGIGSRYELDGFLKKHQVWLEYNIEDFEHERVIGEQLWQRRQAELAEEAARQNR